MSFTESLNDETLDEIFKPRAEYVEVEPGHYKAKFLYPTIKVKLSRNDNLMANIPVAPIATKEGEAVNGKSIYMRVMLEGKAAFQLANLAKALGIKTKEQFKAFSQALDAAIPADIPEEGVEVALSFDGAPLDLTTKQVMVSVKDDEYQGETRKAIGSIWEVR